MMNNQLIIPTPIRFSNPLRQFVRTYRTLDERIKRQYAAVICEFSKDRIPPGRRLHRLSGMDHHYAVYLTRKFRFVYEYIENDCRIGLPVAIGPHDTAYGSI